MAFRAEPVGSSQSSPHQQEQHFANDLGRQSREGRPAFRKVPAGGYVAIGCDPDAVGGRETVGALPALPRATGIERPVEVIETSSGLQTAQKSPRTLSVHLNPRGALQEEYVS